MSPGVYVLESDGQLLEMAEQPYDSEELLQRLLEDHPSLLAGNDIGTGEPRRWLLVSREVGLASEHEGTPRWSADHVFLDQDGIPTLVEVKRSADTRIRREVVGQMLDYAANAVVYWPVEAMRAAFEATCQRKSTNPADVLEEVAGQLDPDAFWQIVRTNLQAGRIRMVFVADEIPTELRRIVEFLNEQMSSAEVLAIEIRQYVGGGRRALAPRVIGDTAAAQRTKGDMPSRVWDEASLFAELERRNGAELAQAARAIYDGAREFFPRISFGKGKVDGAAYPCLDVGQTTYRVIGLWTSGLIEVEFKTLQTRSPFDSESKRLELLERLNGIAGVALPDEAISRYPNIPLSAFASEEARQQLLEALRWARNQVTPQ